MKKVSLHIVFLFVCSISFGQVIETIAGNGTQGYSGNGGPATDAQLNHPWAIREDLNGNIYFTDASNAAVRKIDANTGDISNFFGTGTVGDGPSGSTASSFEINSPYGLDIHDDFMYVTDVGNEKIYRINLLDNSVQVIAGTGTAGFSNDGTMALSAQLNNPQGAAIGTDGLVYFTDSGNHLVRRIQTDGTLETIAGVQGNSTSGDGPVGSATINQPFGIAIDDQNNVYVAEVIEFKIRKIDQTLGLVSTYIGTGNYGDAPNGTSGNLADISTPHDIYFDINGSLYFADTDNNKIKKLYFADNKVYTVAGTGAAGYSGDGGNPLQATMSGPLGIYVSDNGTFYFSDLDNDVIRKVEECVDPDVPFLTVSNDITTINCGETAKLSVSNGNLNSATDWVWYTDSCGATNAGSGILIEPILLQTTTFYARGEGACVNEGVCEEITIYVNSCDSIIEIQTITAFSPNFDGVNDYLFIPQVETGINNTVQVFNRWGDPLKTFSNYDNENVVWDGTDEFGISVGGGTYFYIFESDNFQFSSWINIVK